MFGRTVATTDAQGPLGISEQLFHSVVSPPPYPNGHDQSQDRGNKETTTTHWRKFALCAGDWFFCHFEHRDMLEYCLANHGHWLPRALRGRAVVNGAEGVSALRLPSLTQVISCRLPGALGPASRRSRRSALCSRSCGRTLNRSRGRTRLACASGLHITHARPSAFFASARRS